MFIYFNVVGRWEHLGSVLSMAWKETALWLLSFVTWAIWPAKTKCFLVFFSGRYIHMSDFSPIMMKGLMLDGTSGRLHKCKGLNLIFSLTSSYSCQSKGVITRDSVDIFYNEVTFKIEARLLSIELWKTRRLSPWWPCKAVHKL